MPTMVLDDPRSSLPPMPALLGGAGELYQGAAWTDASEVCHFCERRLCVMEM